MPEETIKKITQITIDGTAYDIDLPEDAKSNIDELTVKTKLTVPTLTENSEDTEAASKGYVDTETTRATTIEAGLKTRLDTMDAKSDVVDVVASAADLNNYDKSELTDKDVIKVLKDENYNNDTTYYRYNLLNDNFNYIGKLGQYVLARTTNNEVYSHSGATQGGINYSTSAIANNIVQRTTNGNIILPAKDKITAATHAVSKDYVDTNISTEASARTSADTTLQTNISAEETRATTVESGLDTAISNHTSNTNNPHEVTKAQVGLGNVDNTSDVNKPISTATQTALNAKQDTLANQTAYMDGMGSAYKVPVIKTNTLGQVTEITEADISTASIDNTAGSESISVNTSASSTKTLNVVTRDTTQTISGQKTFSKIGFSNTISSDTYNSWITEELDSLYIRTRKGSSDLTQGNVIVTIPTLDDPTATNISINFQAKNGTVAITDDLSDFVTGPASASIGDIATYNNANGKVIKDSGWQIDGDRLYHNSNSIVISNDNTPFGGENYIGLTTLNNASLFIGRENDEDTHSAVYGSYDEHLDLGYKNASATRRFRDLYLSRNLTDGTNSVTIANIAKDDNVIHKTGDEDIAGTKTFSNINIYNAYSHTGELGLKTDNGSGTYKTYHLMSGNSGGTGVAKDYYLRLPDTADTSASSPAILATVSDIPAKASDVNEYGKYYVSPTQVRQFQATTGIVPDLLHNINGHDLSGTYTASSVTIDGHPGYKILREGVKLTFNDAHNYMRKMTGSEFTPIWEDGTVPQYSYIIAGDGTFYKPQYDSTNGLVLYPVSKVALDSTVVHKTDDETINGVKNFSSIYLGSSGALTTGGSVGLVISGSNNTISGHNGSDNTFKLSAAESALIVGSDETNIGSLGTNTKYGLTNIIRTIRPVGTTTPATYTYTYPAKNGILAIDEDVVHKGTASSPSTETIYGVKTFSEANGNSSVAINSTGINVSSTSNTFADIWYEAADDSCKVAASKNLNDGNNGWVGASLETGMDSTNTRDVGKLSFITDSSYYPSSITLEPTANASGDYVLTLPAQSGTLATIDDITGGSGSNLVTTNTDQTITGTKTFGAVSSYGGGLKFTAATTGSAGTLTGLFNGSASSYPEIKDIKQIVFHQGFGGTHSADTYTTTLVSSSAPEANRTITLPNKSGTLVVADSNNAIQVDEITGGNDGLVLFAPSNTSVSLEMEDGSIDFMDRDKNTSARFDLSGLSNNTSYYYHFPKSSGTLVCLYKHYIYISYEEGEDDFDDYFTIISPIASNATTGAALISLFDSALSIRFKGTKYSGNWNSTANAQVLNWSSTQSGSTIHLYAYWANGGTGTLTGTAGSYSIPANSGTGFYDDVTPIN